MGDSLVPVCNFVDGITSWATVGLSFGTTLRTMVSQGVGKVKMWKMRLELESKCGKSGGEWDNADSRQPIIHTFFGQAQIFSHSINFEAQNREKYTVVYSKLMIPLYQSDPYNNSVQKNVRGLAVMSMLLGLFHELGLDLLSPGNLTEHVSTISKG